MTTAREIIKQAYRESNVLIIGATPTDDQNDEGLAKLNALISSALGFTAGEGYTHWPVGTEGVDEINAGWSSTDWSMPPVNVRMMVTTTEEQTITLPPFPNNGARIAVIDVTETGGSRNMTIEGNGRLIEGAASITFDLEDVNMEWLYRDDIATWVLLASLDIDDDMPFPIRYDQFFETRLAMRFNPRYGRTMDQQTLAVLNEASNQLKAEFRQKIPSRTDPGVTAMSVQVGRNSGCTPFRRGRYGWMM